MLTFGGDSQPNGRYLQRNLHREVLEQVAGLGRVDAALPAALAALNRAYRNLHPFNGPVLEGVLVAAAYLDLRSRALHLCAACLYPPSRACLACMLFGGRFVLLSCVLSAFA